MYPDVSAKLPGVDLEEKEFDFVPVTDKLTANFWDLATVALHNAGINADDRLQAARKAAAAVGIEQAQEPAVVEADEEEIVYEATFDLPDVGLIPHNANLHNPLGDDNNDKHVLPAIPDGEPMPNQCYPTQAHRSAVGNQPYNAYMPRVTFLQLGTMQAHRSVLKASRLG